MFTDFINRILGAEPRLSVSNRLEDAVPDGRFPLRCRPNGMNVSLGTLSGWLV